MHKLVFIQYPCSIHVTKLKDLSVSAMIPAYKQLLQKPRSITTPHLLHHIQHGKAPRKGRCSKKQSTHKRLIDKSRPFVCVLSNTQYGIFFIISQIILLDCSAYLKLVRTSTGPLPVMKYLWTMPPMPIIVSQPFLISALC